MKKYLIATLFLLASLGLATLAAAQESPQKSEGQTTERRSSETNVDIDVQRGEQGQRGPEGRPGPEGPEGAPGPRGAAGASGGTILGMDSTVALLLGLALVCIVIVALVAASRGGREA